LLLVVVGLLARVQQLPGVGVVLLFILAVIGYGAPAFFLLGRSGRFPPPADALFVRSTLIVRPEADPPGMTFSWRNQGFADLFHESNSKAVEGSVVEITEEVDQDEDEA
jgi:hypothetical protein